MQQQDTIQAYEHGGIATDPQSIPLKKGNQAFIAAQYLLQGILSGLPQTIILTYLHVPNYLILSLFEAVKIPSTFKFLFAPILQTYTSVYYGKRKLWIMISGVMMGTLILIASFHTSEAHQVLVAIIFLISMIFNGCADIAVDALSLKEIAQPERISLIQTAAKKIGNIIGGFVFLKLVSNKFGAFLGMTHSIMSVPTFFRIIALCFISLQIITHFFYKEEILEEQIEKKDVGICDTIKQYRVFFNFKQKYFRTGLLLMVLIFGLLFFGSSYQFELMKKGFSKERINQIHTVSVFLILIIAYFYSKLANEGNMYKLAAILIFGRLILYLFAFFVRPERTLPVIIYLFTEDMLITLSGITDGIIINYFPVTAVSGMMITMLNSMKNVGHNFTFHLMVVNAVGHRAASIFGLIIQALFMIFGYSRMVKWVKQGQLEVHEPIVVRQSEINDHMRQQNHQKDIDIKSEESRQKSSPRARSQFLTYKWDQLDRSIGSTKEIESKTRKLSRQKSQDCFSQKIQNLEKGSRIKKRRT